MNKSNAAILKPGKEKAIRNYHHWIFSGAIESLPSFKDGDFLNVFSSTGSFLGSGYFNRRSGIIGRMLSFDETPPLIALERKLESALKLRKEWFKSDQTTAYRLINGEGDGIPGLIIDIYEQTVVIQCSTKGMDRLKTWIIDWLNRNIHPRTIYEKSLSPSRKEEGLQDEQKFLYGIENPDLCFRENGLLFTAHLIHSQKTGFFLDHREMRQWIKELAKNKKVLNAFSYTGGFTVYALAGGAESVDSIDCSKDAIEACQKHVILNGFEATPHQFICRDVFEFLHEEKELPYNLVILDPPAFAKKQKDIIAACRGYKDINRLAIQKMPSQSLLLTCSCSYHVNEELFQKILFQAASEAKRQVRIVGRHRLAPDHPVNLYHPESNYLKSFLLYIE